LRNIAQARSKFPPVRLILLIALVIVAAVTVAAKCEGRFAGGTEDFTEERLETSIVIGQSDTDYGVTLAAVAAFMGEIAFGFQVEVVELTGNELQGALESGRVDLVLDAGQPGNADWFKAAVASGSIVSTGPTYFEGDFPVSGAVSPKLAEQGADFVAALTVMELRQTRLEETETWWHENDIDGEFRAAVYFLWNFNYENDWKSWMTWDPAERIRQKLERFAKVRYPDLYEGIEFDERFNPVVYDENGDAIIVDYDAEEGS
jgi:hypothetical protein